MRLVGVRVRVLRVEETLLGLLGLWGVVRGSVRPGVGLLGEFVLVVVDALGFDTTVNARPELCICAPPRWRERASASFSLGTPCSLIGT